MSRQELIKLINKGKIWRVYHDENPDEIWHQGTKTSCKNYIKANLLEGHVKRGTVRLAQLLWENNE